MTMKEHLASQVKYYYELMNYTTDLDEVEYCEQQISRLYLALSKEDNA